MFKRNKIKTRTTTKTTERTMNERKNIGKTTSTKKKRTKLYSRKTYQNLKKDDIKKIAKSYYVDIKEIKNKTKF